MSACEHYQELISRMLDEDLDAGERALLADHLQACPDCAALHAAFSSLSTVMSEDLEDAPESLRENVMAQIRRESIRRKNRLSRPMRNLLGAAACLVLIAGISFTLRHMPFAAGGSGAVNNEAAAISGGAGRFPEISLYRTAEDTSAPQLAGGSDMDDGAEGHGIAPSGLAPIPMPEEAPEELECEPEEGAMDAAADSARAVEFAPLVLQPTQAEALLALLDGDPVELGPEVWFCIPNYQMQWDKADGSAYIDIFFDGDTVYYFGTETQGTCLARCRRAELEDFVRALQDG